MTASVAEPSPTRTGWRRSFAIIASGAIGALAMPPVGFIPAMAVSLSIAVRLLDVCASGGRGSFRRSLSRSFFYGWLWGFGYLVAGLWWLGSPFLVEADQFAWAMPFGVLGLPAVLALFPACGFAIAHALWSPGTGRLFAFAFGLAVSEWLRGHIFTGFPWNLIGMALGQNLWLMQGAALGGVYWLTLLASLILAAPATLFDGPNVRFSQRFGPSLAAIAALAALAAYGAWRIPAQPQPTIPGVTLRLMQPNLPQDAKFNATNAQGILALYLNLSVGDDSPDGKMHGPTHVIWPESAFPFILDQSPEALAQIAAILPPGKILITGAARMSDPLPGEQTGRFFNAIAVVDDQGTVQWQYDKTHLVPFGEYVPAFLKTTIAALGLRQFVHIPGGFDSADRRKMLHLPGIGPVVGTICYESIFSNEVLPQDDNSNDAKAIINVTNDAWFGVLTGPYQHFAQSRLRTVEEGLPLIRVANTGISAAIDPYGQIVAILPLGAKGYIDTTLPIAAPQTIFRQYGELVFMLCSLLCFAVAFYCSVGATGRRTIRFHEEGSEYNR